MADRLLTVRREGAVAVVELDRAEKRNALTREMLRTLVEEFRAADADPSVNVIVLAGAGPDFCAGFDLAALPSGEPSEERVERERTELFEMGLGIRNTSKPTVAAVQGACVAGGLLISLTCDLVVMSDDAYFYNPLPRMGGVALELLLEPWDIGFRRAKRYLFTAERIPAPVALDLGMATDVVPRAQVRDAAMALAGRIAGMPPVTLQLLKRSLNLAQDRAGMTAGLAEHFAIHQLGHESSESKRLLHEARRGRDLKDYFKKRDAGEL